MRRLRVSHIKLVEEWMKCEQWNAKLASVSLKAYRKEERQGQKLQEGQLQYHDEKIEYISNKSDYFQVQIILQHYKPWHGQSLLAEQGQQEHMAAY
eukprot:Skav210546  [mRNA]  locus=scaffold1646:37898:38185:- [translate_table: standard]